MENNNNIFMHDHITNLINICLTAFVFCFYKIYNSVILMLPTLPEGTRDFLFDIKEIVAVTTAVLVLIKVIRDLIKQDRKK